MKWDMFCFGNCANGFDIINNPCFIIGCHNCDETRVRPDRLFDIGRIDRPQVLAAGANLNNRQLC